MASRSALCLAAGLSALLAACAQTGIPAQTAVPAAQHNAGIPMGFFVTSTNPGKGGDLGGLMGADAHCQFLATPAGAGERTWRAYLSTRGTLGRPAVNARDRIGPGPWYNAQGVLIARNVDELHGPGNAISKATALTELGGAINGRGDTPNLHDILTGSTPDGRGAIMDADTTCANWTSSGGGSALVGHHDRTGLDGQRAV